MAFMMPVMKNNYDIYKDNRSRKTSECSNASSTSGGTPSMAAAMGVSSAPNTNGRRRKVSECKSESFATSPSHNANSYRMQMQRCQSTRAFPRNASRGSHVSATGGAMSPTRSFSYAAPPNASRSANINRNANANNNDNNNKNSGNTGSGSQNDLSKFHLRLVEKLRKSFRKESAKRS